MHIYPVVLPILLGIMAPSAARELGPSPHGSLITVDIPQYENTGNPESISLFVSLSEPHIRGQIGIIRINDYELKRDTAGRGDGRLTTPEGREIVAAWKFHSDNPGEEELRLNILAIDDENIGDLEVSISLKQTYNAWISAVAGPWVANVDSKPLTSGSIGSSPIDVLDRDLDSKLNTIETLITEIAHFQEQISLKQQLVAQIYDSEHHEFGDADHHLRHCDTLRCLLASVKHHIQRSNDTAPDGGNRLEHEHRHKPHHPEDHERHRRCDRKQHDRQPVGDRFPICFPQQKSWFDATTPASQHISDVTRGASGHLHLYQQDIECHSPRGCRHREFPFAEAILGVFVIGAAIFLFSRTLMRRKSWMQSVDGPAGSRWNVKTLTGLASLRMFSSSQHSASEGNSDDGFAPEKSMYKDEE